MMGWSLLDETDVRDDNRSDHYVVGRDQTSGVVFQGDHSSSLLDLAVSSNSIQHGQHGYGKAR